MLFTCRWISEFFSETTTKWQTRLPNLRPHLSDPIPPAQKASHRTLLGKEGRVKYKMQTCDQSGAPKHELKEAGFKDTQCGRQGGTDRCHPAFSTDNDDDSIKYKRKFVQLVVPITRAPPILLRPAWPTGVTNMLPLPLGKLPRRDSAAWHQICSSLSETLARAIYSLQCRNRLITFELNAMAPSGGVPPRSRLCDYCAFCNPVEHACGGIF